MQAKRCYTYLKPMHIFTAVRADLRSDNVHLIGGQKQYVD